VAMPLSSAAATAHSPSRSRAGSWARSWRSTLIQSWSLLRQPVPLQSGLKNIIIEQRDFVAQGCGREYGSAGLVLLFNILHIEDPVNLLKEAHRVLHPGGTVGVIHWNHDISTPRGPPLDIRPRPEQCRAWGEQAGLRWVRDQALPGSSWHWGMVLEKR
jgi:hypothetical protein